MSEIDVDEGWRDQALCAQTDPETFFPEKGSSSADAKRVCDSCDVRAQCLRYALRNGERFGIWGGLSVSERDRITSALPGQRLGLARARRQTRDQAILAMVDTEVGAPVVAASFGVSDQTVYRAIKARRARERERLANTG
ncbi:WhiB family transcriptional regulator [Promicromonospora aerolata]|uniref:Transcriptional regulator WhiB n=1 Tax=Promicromonospora aerolata TaxID=195749 RepID=A0ABW4V2Q4_9MICO